MVKKIIGVTRVENGNKKNNIQTISSNMDKKDLKKLTKSQLISMLLKKEKPEKKNFENLFDDDPFPEYLPEETEFDKTIDEYKSMNRKLKSEDRKITKKYKQEKPKIEQTDKALKGFTKSYEISVVNKKDPLIQFNSTRSSVGKRLEKSLKSMKGLKFVETVKVEFEKITMDDLSNKPYFRGGYRRNNPTRDVGRTREKLVNHEPSGE